MAMPSAYTGNEKYIFISYAHKDSAAVFPIICRLAENGYRVWYDAGIDPGSEWDENIAGHIETCGYFIAFVSNNYLNSNNCKDELNFARDLEKERLIVYLEKVDLPSGMAMRMNRLQSIFKYTYPTENDFYSKLFTAQNIHLCHESGETPVMEEEPAPQNRTYTPPKTDAPPHTSTAQSASGTQESGQTASQAWAQSFEQTSTAFKKTAEQAFQKTNAAVSAAGGDNNCLVAFILGLISIFGYFGLAVPPVIGVILGHKGIDLGATPQRVTLAKWGIVLSWISLFMFATAVAQFVGIVVMAVIMLVFYTQRKKKLGK